MDRGKDKLTKVFRCCARGEPENWVLSNREWGRSKVRLPGLLASVTCWGRGTDPGGDLETAMRQEGNGSIGWFVGSTGSLHSSEGGCSWCFVVALGQTLKTGSGLVKRERMFQGQLILPHVKI